MAVSPCPDIKSVEITKNTEFIICACDGIWDCLTSQQACDFVQNQKKKFLNLDIKEETKLEVVITPPPTAPPS